MHLSKGRKIQSDHDKIEDNRDKIEFSVCNTAMLIGNPKLVNLIKDGRQSSGESVESLTHCYVNEVKLYNFKGDRIQHDSFCKRHPSNLIVSSKANVYPFNIHSLYLMLIKYDKNCLLS